MAGRIRDSDVALVRERSPIAEIIGSTLTLRPAGGGRLKGLCPFHEEKSPSFSVNTALGVYHCFGCGVSGDAISFLRQTEALSFAEAVERLASRAGITLTYEQGGAAAGRSFGQRQRLLDAHRLAAEFFQEQLSTAAAAVGREFLASRGFDLAAAARFGVGYAPDGWEALVGHLTARGFSAQELLTGGLAQQGRRGPVDRFRGRLVWPIRERTGEVIGFGARRLAETDTGPKYLNTPETPLYRKSTVLYGLDLARKEIALQRRAVVVEGYTDVMACHLAGVGTAVATCGTAFGPEHVNVLRLMLMDHDEFRGEVIYTFDGDAAGRNAALRAFVDDQRFVAQTFVAVGPDGMDPCELRLAQGDAAVRDLVAARVPLFTFAIRSALARYDLDTAEGRVQALQAAAPVVASIRDRSLRPEYARQLAGWLGMEVGPVVARVREVTGRQQAAPRAAAGEAGRALPAAERTSPSRQRAASGEPAPSGEPAASTRPRSSPDPVAAAVERDLLKIALQRPDLVGTTFDTLDPYVFTVPAYRALAEACAKAGGATAGAATAATAPGAWIRAVQETAGIAPLAALVAELAVEMLPVTGSPDLRYAAAVLARIQELAVSREIVELRSRVERADPSGPAYQQLFTELFALESRKRALRDAANGGS